MPVNAVVVVEFDEPIDPASVNGAPFQLFNNTTGVEVAGSRSVDATGRLAFFMPSSPLAVGTQHQIVVTTGVEDVAGNPLAFFGSAFFTTAFTADTAPPQVVGVDPADGTTGAPTNAIITIQMSEAVDPISVTAANVSLRVGTTPVEATLSLLDGNRRIRLEPAKDLTPSSVHTLTIAGLRDVAGNIMAAPVEITFTTGAGADLIAPRVIQVDPADGATGVGTNAVVEIRFSERINPLAVTEATFFVQTSNGVRVTGNITVAADGLSAAFTPSTALAPSTTYQVRVLGITDLVGQAISSFFSNFTTAAQ